MLADMPGGEAALASTIPLRSTSRAVLTWMAMAGMPPRRPAVASTWSSSAMGENS
jgi:hypothetical protein